MQYQKAFDIWAMPAPFYKHIQRGQWVYAGRADNKGIFLGVKPNGTVVVAWYGNAKRQNFREYIKTLTAYSKG